MKAIHKHTSLKQVSANLISLPISTQVSATAVENFCEWKLSGTQDYRTETEAWASWYVIKQKKNRKKPEN